MYLQELQEGIFTTTLVKIKYDCHGEERLMKYCDAKKNFEKNKGKHICRSCWLKSDDNPFKKEEVKQKIKNTINEKYDGVNPVNSPENIEKRKQQFKDEEYLKQWNEKRKITSQKIYGTDHPMHSKIVQDKQKEGMQKNHGVDYPYQSPEIMANMKANNLKNHGVENVAQMPETQEKMKKTREERYGVEHYNQLPEMRDYLRENCKDWLKESWENPWAKGITRPEEWNEKQSITVSNLIEKGEWKGGGNTYKGKYKSKKCKRNNPFYRSGYELIVHWWADNNDEIIWYDYEPFQVPYYDTEGKLRHYTLDFLFKFNNGKLLAVEVKNNYTSESNLNKLKYKALKDVIYKDNIEFEVWTNDNIKMLGYKIKDILSCDLVKEIYSPK